MSCCCCNRDSTAERKPRDRDILGRRANVGVTDPFCCILFLVFISGMGALTFYAYINGDIRRVTNNYDCYGNICGKANNVKLLIGNANSGMNTSDRPFVYHTYSDYWKYSRSICVTKCPSRYLRSYKDVKDFAVEKKAHLCDYNIAVEDMDKKDYSAGLSRENYFKSPCPILPVEPQIDILGFCIRSNLSQLRKMSQFNEIGGINQFKPAIESLIRDFLITWKEILFLSAGSLVLSFVMVFLIRFIASAVVYVILILTVFTSLGLTVFLWLCYFSQEKILNNQVAEKLKFLTGDVLNTRSFLYLSITSTVIMVVLFLVICVMWSRMIVVTYLFKEASKCLEQIPCLLFQPVLTFIVLAGFFVYWCTTFGFLMSIAHFEINNRTGCVRYPLAILPKFVWIYFLVGLIWITEFILAGQQMVVAGVVSKWYFQKASKTGESPDSCPIFKSTMRFLCHHSGSIAFGSFIITAIRLPRWFLMYISKKMKASSTPGEACISVCTKCCICCLYCLENCLKFLNKNAYAVIAIEGTNFCESAQRAFSLLINNVLRVAALNSVGDFILFLAKLCVALISAGVSIVIFMRREDLYFYPLPVILVSVVAYFFAHCVLTLYETVLDVMMICFCVEEEVQKLQDSVDIAGIVPMRSHADLKDHLTKANNTLNRASGHISLKESEMVPLA